LDLPWRGFVEAFGFSLKLELNDDGGPLLPEDVRRVIRKAHQDSLRLAPGAGEVSEAASIEAVDEAGELLPRLVQPRY
jgi:hypothetical protein